jgi:hypothetical protein
MLCSPVITGFFVWLKMTWFGRKETKDTAQPAADAVVAVVPSASTAAPAGRKIRMNFKYYSPEAIRAMARSTLQPLIEEQEREAAAQAARWANPEIGDVMPDDSVYAGLSPDTGKQMFAMPKDAGVQMDFNAAAQYAKKLSEEKTLGHDDWRVPTKNELNVLFNNLAKIGGFDISGSKPAGWYWSSTPDDTYDAWCQRFSDGHQVIGNRNLDSSVRCVR